MKTLLTSVNFRSFNRQFIIWRSCQMMSCRINPYTCNTFIPYSVRLSPSCSCMITSLDVSDCSSEKPLLLNGYRFCWALTVPGTLRILFLQSMDEPGLSIFILFSSIISTFCKTHVFVLGTLAHRLHSKWLMIRCLPRLFTQFIQIIIRYKFFY